jgi:hypothetical protein
VSALRRDGGSVMDESYLSPKQVAWLLHPISKNRVAADDKGMSHVQAYDIRATLTRIFGFARWDGQATTTLLYEDVKADDRDPEAAWKRKVSVGYKASYRLVVKAPDGTVLADYTEDAAGGATNFPINQRAEAHDFAMKTAESQAMKRCATNLGDQFGLSLYNKGSVAPLVNVTAVMPEGPQEPATAPDAHITEPLASEDPKPAEPAPQVSQVQRDTVADLKARTDAILNRGKTA